MRETDNLQAIENRYLREIEEKKRAQAALGSEIAQLEAYVQSLREMRAREEGRPLEVAKTGRVTTLYPPDDLEGSRPRGWLKEMVMRYIVSVSGKNFGGGDIARWIRAQGEKLEDYQYNQIFMILKAMAKEGKEVKKVNGQYERISGREQDLHSTEDTTEGAESKGDQ